MSVKNESRRRFLKASAASAAGIALTANIPSAFASNAGAWTDGMKINPNIDNLRVVVCHDTNMFTSMTTFPDFSNGLAVQNAVNKTQVETNLDKMAMQLASVTSASAAWAKIFQQPSKGYAASKVAVKVNMGGGGVGLYHPHATIIGKVCKVLMGLGVPAANITLYDGHDGGMYGYYNMGSATTNLIPTGVQTAEYGQGVLGGTAPLGSSNAMPAVAVPGQTYTAQVLPNINNGTFDILVNLAVNKGHSTMFENGNFTMTMKNHFGTWQPAPNSHNPNPSVVNSGFQYLMAINKSSAILGGTPVRQQLCIIDSLWGATTGPFAEPDPAWYGRIVMGTFSPAVDFLTEKKIRIPVMGAVISSGMAGPSIDANSYLDSFGYTSTQYSSLDFVDYLAPVGVITGAAGAEHQPLDLHVVSDRAGHERVTLHMPADSPALVNVYNVKGDLVRSMTSSQRSIVWDAADANGAHVSAGTYVLKVSAGQITKSVSVAVR